MPSSACSTQASPQDGEPNELPERESQKRLFDDRREKIQQPPRVPGKGFVVEAFGGAHGVRGNAPCLILAAAHLEGLEPDREGGEDRLAGIGVEVVRSAGTVRIRTKRPPPVEGWT